jgi:curli biogenesis system outer membrane secretion channel CsgG
MKRRLTLGAILLVSTLTAVPLLASDKPVLAVAEFKNETSAGWWGSGVGRELAGMLTNELAATGSFRTVERSKLDRVLDEQDLASSGRVARGSAQVGKLTGAEYIVVATVTSFESNTRGTGTNLRYRGVGVGGRSEEAYIAVDLRVINSTTGEVDFVRTVEARSGGAGVNLGVYRGGFGGSLSSHERTPTGKAIRGVIMEISDYLSCVMVDRDGCEREYAAKERSRRDRTKRSIKLD